MVAKKVKMVSLVMQILIACFRTSLQTKVTVFKCVYVCMYAYATVVLAWLCVACVPSLNIDKTFNSHFDFQLTYNNKIVQQ